MIFIIFKGLYLILIYVYPIIYNSYIIIIMRSSQINPLNYEERIPIKDTALNISSF
jgi:hypothetical protein